MFFVFFSTHQLVHVVYPLAGHRGGLEGRIGLVELGEQGEACLVVPPPGQRVLVQVDRLGLSVPVKGA